MTMEAQILFRHKFPIHSVLIQWLSVVRWKLIPGTIFSTRTDVVVGDVNIDVATWATTEHNGTIFKL